MRIRPTELGVKGTLLLAALVVAFLAAAYSNLFFLIIAFCVVLGVLGCWWAIGNGKAVTAKLSNPGPAAAGQRRTCSLVISPRRPAFDLTFAIEVASDAGSALSERHELTHVPALRDRQTVTVELPPLPRGVQRVTRVICGSRYPFGLVRSERDLAPAEPIELVTYPDPDTGGNRRQHLGAVDHAGNARRGDTIAGLREHRPGDSLGEMHWKATARRGTPIVKERERSSTATEFVTIDRRTESTAAFEVVLADATAKVLSAQDRERPLRLVSQDCRITLAPGGDPTPALRWLATAEPLPLSAPAPDPGRAEEVVHA
ncbi:MAG: DUF58 domain-containing protein [bacterium]|nr:DUF58 domain-containing protein [bacterium]